MSDTRHIAIERFFVQVTRNVVDAGLTPVALAMELAKLEGIVANREEAYKADIAALRSQLASITSPDSTRGE